MIFHHGGKQIARGVSPETATLLDLFPTILSVTDTSCHELQCDGQILNLNERQSKQSKRTVIGELGNSEFPQFFIRKGSWKLIYLSGHEKYELYNLETDPSELNNLADERPDKLNELKLNLETWKSSESNNWKPKVKNININWKEELKLSHL